MLAWIEHAAGKDRRQHVACLDDADHDVDAAIAGRQARMLGLHQQFADGALIGLQIDPVDLGARRHHRAHGAVAKPHDAGNHAPLVGFDGAVMLGLGNQHLDLLVGHLLFAFAALAEQPQYGAAGNVEQEDQRRRNGGEDGHRRRHPGCHAFGIAQGDLLGHQFTDDQREIGDDGNDNADAERIGDAFANARRGQEDRQPVAKRGAGEGAGKDADQGNADLHRRQEFARVLSQAQVHGRRR